MVTLACNRCWKCGLLVWVIVPDKNLDFGDYGRGMMVIDKCPIMIATIPCQFIFFTLLYILFLLPY